MEQNKMEKTVYETSINETTYKITKSENNILYFYVGGKCLGVEHCLGLFEFIRVK